jgi:hypothetical protein
MAKSKRDPNFPMQGKGGGMGGVYARKAENLTAKELKAAGAKKAAAKRTVSISSTKRVTSGVNKGKTVGPGGKPLTGSVRLQNGSMAVYKDGKRVVKAAAKKTAARPATSRTTVTKTGPGSNPDSGKKPKMGEVRIGKAKKYVNKWDGKKWVKVSQTNGTAVFGKTTTSRPTTKPAATPPRKETPDGRNASNAFTGNGSTGSKYTAAQKSGESARVAGQRYAAQAAAAKNKPKPGSSAKPTTAKDVWDKSPHGMVVNAVGKALTGNTPALKKGDVHYTAIGARYWTGSKWVGAVKKNGKWQPQG